MFATVNYRIQMAAEGVIKLSRWAILNDTNTTINIIEGERLEGLQLPLGQSIVNIDNYHVAIGDSYDGGIWHNADGVVAPKLSAEQEIALLKADKVSTLQQITALELALVELYEGGMTNV